MLLGLVGPSQVDELEVSREVEKAVVSFEMGSQQEMTGKLLKNGCEASIDWLWELLQAA